VTWDSVTPGGVRTGHVPRPPTVAPAAAATLAGAFDLHVIRTTQYSGPSPAFDTLAVASLILRSPPPAFRHPPNHAIEFIAYGWSNIDLRRLGPVSLAYSPADSSADRPGAQVSYNSDTETLGFVLGNAFSPTRGMALDAGVYFDVIAVDSTGFRGWWQDGGLSPAKGYFCAWRAQEVWNPLPRA
jgi:hypothetical protein